MMKTDPAKRKISMRTPVVVITGASSGIGAATARLFSAKGFTLGLVARDLKAMEARELPNALCLSVDVTDFSALREAIHQVETKLGPIDCLINNAGFAKGGDFLSLAHEEQVNTINVNVLGVINSIESVLPSMRERKQGTIITISSVADRYPRPLIPTYAASKAAVKSLSDSLRVANAKYGIRFCNLAPAKIKTPMLIAANLDDSLAIPADEFAKAILWVYEQPQHICIRDLVFAPTAYET